jgi:hypothetical protein
MKPFIVCPCGYEGTPPKISVEPIRKHGKPYYRLQCPKCGRELDIPKSTFPKLPRPRPG